MSAYDIHPMPPPLEDDLLTLLSRVETSTVGHWRYGGVCDPKIVPVTRGVRALGVAVTVMLPGADSTLMHYAVDQLRPGDILVVDRLGDRRHACVGSMVALAAKMHGAAAIVIDGPVTDIEALRVEGFPIWSRGTTALTTKRLDLGGRMNVPVSVGGAVVVPGDAVLCDCDGVVVLPAVTAREEVLRAIARQEAEGELRAQILAGTPIGTLTGADARVKNS